MKLGKFKIFVYLLILFSVLITTAFGCKQKISGKLAQKLQPITLQYWRVWDGQDDFAPIIAAYNRVHPNVKIHYRKFRYSEYEEAITEAFASDRAPDIISLHNTWMHEYQKKNFLAPMPARTIMAYPEIADSIKKEIVWKLKPNTSPSLAAIKKAFIGTVYDNIVIKSVDPKTKQAKENVYGLPLSVDTMALFYNLDLFNNAGIINPPEYWNREFQEDVKKLTIQNNRGEIIQSGVALGGSDNINRSTDILSLLMMQNGAEMTRGSNIAFHQAPTDFGDKGYNPGIDALRFYTDFANPAKEVYSWNDNLDSSLDMFVSNRLAMMFGYSYMLLEIKSRAPKLNFEVVKLPQIEGNTLSMNYANYWVEAVSRKSEHTEEAWDFIKHLAYNKKNVQSYLEATQKPPALRSLVEEMREEENALGVFSNQVLTAKSWYRGYDAETAEIAMKEMMDKVIKGQGSLNEIVEFAVRKMQQTFK
ncbi:MAG: extracellular solute-binding protein [Patescibacteria group bacterium]|nr:extracellular solute-binding protein [Patescibacteria group bacterium]